MFKSNILVMGLICQEHVCSDCGHRWLEDEDAKSPNYCPECGKNLHNVHIKSEPETEDLISLNAAIAIASYAVDEHPYDKNPEKPETFSEYNQGWNDACDYIRDRLEIEGGNK